MHQVPTDDIRQVGKGLVRTFRLNCPSCGESGVFSTMHPTPSPPAKTTVCIAHCPGCNFRIRVVNIEDDDGLLVFVHPEPSTRLPLGERITAIEAVDRAYHSAVNAYNSGLWPSCAVACRRTLEGIIKVRSDESDGTLFARLQSFFENEDLSEPLIHLTGRIREGGNLGAHFDLEKEPTEEVARMMLDLIEYFLEFLFILPVRSRALEESLGQLDSDS